MVSYPAIKGGSSVGGRFLIALFVLSCVLQLVGLYRPTGPPTPDAIPYLDKLGHLVVFALPVAVIMVYRASRGAVSVIFSAVVIAIFAAHAVISEIIQARWLPDRSGDPYDVLADLIGIAVGCGVAVLIRRRRAVPVTVPRGTGE